MCTIPTFSVAWFRYIIDFPVSQVMGSVKWTNELFCNFSVERFYLMEYETCCINLHFKGVRGGFGLGHLLVLQR